MKHDNLMKRPKKFCVECGGQRATYSVRHKTFSMLHCSKCKAEVARAGDGPPASRANHVEGGIDANSFSRDFVSGRSFETLACEYPDVMSDEHCIWEPNSGDEELNRRLRMIHFENAFAELTPKQQEVVKAVSNYGSHLDAARHLGLRRITVTTIIRRLQKKLSEVVNIQAE